MAVRCMTRLPFPRPTDCCAGPCSLWQVSKNEDEMNAVAGSLDGIIDTVAGGLPLGSHWGSLQAASLRWCASAAGASRRLSLGPMLHHCCDGVHMVSWPAMCDAHLVFLLPCPGPPAAKHDLASYLSLIKTDGALVMVG